jgi:sarcosine oxidase
LSYFEHPSYVPLLRRAYSLWRDLERESGLALLHVTGIVEIGSPESTLIQGTLASAKLHDLPHDVFAAPDLMRRFPAFRVPSDYIGMFQRDGGWLAVEPSVTACIALAQAAGAQIRTETRIDAVERHGSGVRIRVGREVIDAAGAVVTAGPWTASVLPTLRHALRVTRQVMAWFEPAQSISITSPDFPVFILESRYGMHYGIPAKAPGEPVKVAKHHHRDETVDPDDYDRSVSADDEALIRSALADYVPALNGRMRAAQACLYTMTSDGHFLIDPLPDSPSVIVASACSGHGFKFAPVMGEILADLATTGRTSHDITRFSANRLS